MLGVNLRKTKHFRVGQSSAELLAEAFEVLDFLLAECEAFLLVVLAHVVDIHHGVGLLGDCEHILVNVLIHTLQHLVENGFVALCHGFKTLYALHALYAHVLGDFHGVGAPRSNHFLARAYESACYLVVVQVLGVAKQPNQLFIILLRQRLLKLNGVNRGSR